MKQILETQRIVKWETSVWDPISNKTKPVDVSFT